MTRNGRPVAALLAVKDDNQLERLLLAHSLATFRPQVPEWTEILSTAKLPLMSTIGATEFKQQCLAILDRLGPEGIVITKHGKPVAKLVPIETESSALIGSLAGKIRIHGDLLSTGLRWDAES